MSPQPQDPGAGGPGSPSGPGGSNMSIPGGSTSSTSTSSSADSSITSTTLTETSRPPDVTTVPEQTSSPTTSIVTITTGSPPFEPSSTQSSVTGLPAVGTSSASSAIASSQGDGSGLSTAAIVGIALGCLIAGIAAGVVAAFLLFRRRKNNESEPLYMSAYSPAMQDDAKYLSDVPQSPMPPSMIGPPSPPHATDGPDSVQMMEQFLLTAVPDKRIAADLKALGELIQKHVKNNYHRQPTHTNQAALTQTLIELGLGKDAAIAPGQIAALALAPKTRLAALQHVIARAVIGSLALSATSRFSLLPASMAAFMREMSPNERHRGNPDAVSTAFTRWRQLSVFLIHPCRSDKTPLIPTHASVGEKARELVTALNGFLGLFVDLTSSEGVEQERHLYDLVMECAKFGYMLISQPGEFRLRYDGGPSPSDIVVCPGLDKISDEHGNRYSPTRTLLAPTIEGTS